MLGALSYALDITEGEPPGHAVRTLAIGMRLAEQLRLGDDVRSALFYALLLKDAGCSANASRLSSLFQADDQPAKAAMKRVDWSRSGTLALYTWRSIEPGGSPLAKVRRMRAITQEDEVTRESIGTRCERGAEIARMLELPEPTQDAIRALDEHWDGSGHPLGLRGEAIPLLGRILCLAQSVEVFVRTMGARGAYGMAIKRRGRWFDPALVDALLGFRDDAAFWGPLEDPRAIPPVAGWEPQDRVLRADDEQLDRVAEAFARVIDAKSPYTASHSAGVATYAHAVGVAMGMDHEQQRDIRRAGLLHDIGKLAISSRILDKPGRLTEEEFAAMREHTRYTLQILDRVQCFRHLAGIAACPSRAARRLRLPPRPGGLRPAAPGAHPRRRRRLRRAHRRPPLPGGDAARAGARDRARAGRDRPVPGGGRGAGDRAGRGAGLRGDARDYPRGP